MPETFVVAFVVGVTPGKWARVWGERMPAHPLSLAQVGTAQALAALADGTAHVALLREPFDTGGLHIIPLYEEQQFVVAPKDHAIEAVDSVVLSDLAGENLLDGDWAEAIELVAANVGVALMPQSVSRALSRRDVVARPVTDGATTRVVLAWSPDADSPEVEEFVGVVRGRTANSSRGTVDPVVKTPLPPRTKRPAPKKSAPKFPNRKKG